MKKQGKIIIVVLIVLFSAVAVFSFYLYPDNVIEKNSSINSDSAISNTNRESGSSSVNSNKTAISSSLVLGTNEYGKVIKKGPYGNINSPVKVAYIVGVHPLESNSHKAAIESLKSQEGSLKKCYYIYRVVTQDADNYDKGRMNGQLLAKSFVVPDIKSNGFKLAVDLHSNRGNYEEKRFLFAPIEGSKSESIARNVKNGIPGFVYHFPFSQTSPQYVTIPLINAGIPAIVFETDLYEPYGTTKSYTDKLILAVDNAVL